MDFVQNISQDGKSVDILLSGTIGGGLDGDAFARDLLLLSDSGAKEVNIYINSNGGSIFQGSSIITSMIILRQRGVKISTINSGIADSMASVIFAFGDRGRRKIYDYATVMVHEPLVLNNGVAVKISELEDGALKSELLQKKENLLTILSGSLTIGREMIQDFMEKETTFNSVRSIEVGLADEIISSLNIPNEIAAIGIEDRESLMVACSNIKIHTLEDTMNKEIIDLLGLAVEASNEEVLNMIQRMKISAEGAHTLEEELAEKTVELQRLESELKEKQEQEVTEVVNSAISEGKFKEESRDFLVAQGSKDFVALKELVSYSTKIEHVDVSGLIDQSGANDVDSSKNDAIEFAKMRFNDQKALSELEKTNPSKYERMSNAYINALDRKEIDLTNLKDII